MVPITIFKSQSYSQAYFDVGRFHDVDVKTALRHDGRVRKGRGFGLREVHRQIQTVEERKQLGTLPQYFSPSVTLQGELIELYSSRQGPFSTVFEWETLVWLNFACLK